MICINNCNYNSKENEIVAEEYINYTITNNEILNKNVRK